MTERKFPLEKGYWEEIINKFPTVSEASKSLGCAERTIYRYIKPLGLKWKHQGYKISDTPIEEIKELIMTMGGISPAARYLGVHRRTLQEKLNSEGVAFNDIMFEYQSSIAPQLSHKGICGDNGIIITADYHSPFTSLKWLDRLLLVAKKEKIKELLIAGDFFDFDRLSWWLRQAQAEDLAVKLEDELRFSEMMLEKLEEQFDKLYFIGGNHWARLLKNVSHSVSSDRLMGLVGKKADPRYTMYDNFDWVLIDDKVRVTHPKRARKLDYTLARDLSILYPEQWLVVAHRHRANEGTTPDGKRPMIEIGWMGDVERMRYVQYVDSTYYKWQNGFATYKNGALRNITEWNYDWRD